MSLVSGDVDHLEHLPELVYRQNSVAVPIKLPKQLSEHTLLIVSFSANIQQVVPDSTNKGFDILRINFSMAWFKDSPGILNEHYVLKIFEGAHGDISVESEELISSDATIWVILVGSDSGTPLIKTFESKALLGSSKTYRVTSTANLIEGVLGDLQASAFEWQS